MTKDVYSGGYMNGYKLDAVVWYRRSTEEWVLTINGEINDMSFSCNHPQSKDLAPEDVSGLPEVYDRTEKLEKQLESAIKWLEWQQQNQRVINHNLTLFLAEVKEDLKK